MNNHDLRNTHQNDVDTVKRGYTIATAKLPDLKRGAKIAPAITESWFKGIEEAAGESFASDRVLQRAKFAHKTLVDSIDAMEVMRSTRNPADTPAVHLNKVASAGKQLVSSTDKQFTSVRADINERRNEVKSQIKARLGLDTSSTQTNEIRAIIRGMNEKDRISALTKAVETGDKTILSAIWDAHEVTIGVEAKLLDSLKASATHKHAGDLVAFRAALDKAEDLLLESFFDTSELTKQAIGGGDAVRKFAEQAEKADLAAAGFNSLVGSSQ